MTIDKAPQGVVCEKCGHRTVVPELCSEWRSRADPTIGVFVCGIRHNHKTVVVNPVEYKANYIAMDHKVERELTFAQLRRDYEPRY